MSNGRRLEDLGEDATGFGRLEFRTIRDGLLRPREQLESYMTGGPGGGGLYTRPIRLYLALCGVMMVMLFMSGGSETMFNGLPAEALEPFLAESGKSRDAFLADVDGWFSLALVPILAACYALAAAPLIRWWDPEDLGWTRAFRASFVFLNAWTVPILPLTWLAFDQSTALYSMLFLTVVAIVTFLRMGKGRWYRTTAGGVGKALVLSLAIQIGGLVGSIPLTTLGLLGGLYGP